MSSLQLPVCAIGRLFRRFMRKSDVQIVLTKISILQKMLFIFISVSIIHFVNGHGLDVLISKELSRLKRYDYWRHDDFPAYGRDHPRTWGNSDYSSYNQHHPVYWGNDEYTSDNQHNPIPWNNNGYAPYNQENPTILRNEDFTTYTDYTGGWGSFDVTTYDRGSTASGRNGDFATFDDNFSDRQLFTEDPPISEPQVNPTNSEVLRKSTTSAPTRRISELKCDEYLRNRTIREEYYKGIGQYTYVIGGRLTKPGEFPHMGAVGWKAVKGTWIFICGSSLISKKFMLTAGHCSKVSSRYPNVANRSPEIVRLGDKNIIDVMSKGLQPYDIKIQRIIVHPQYNPPKKYFDIAIIELQNDVYIDKTVQPACLWTNHDTSPLGSKATITGWGVIETATLRTSPELQAADVDIINSDVCDDLLRPLCTRLWCGMAESQLCAGSLDGGIDTCQGDSGGPLQVKINSTSEDEGSIHYLIGVTSFGHGCAQANKPAVYTRVSSFIDWIENVVWGTTT